MPMTATMAPYTLFILDDDTPMNPREDHDCLGKWSAGTADTAWARNMIMTSQAISCEACCFLNTPAAMTGTIRFCISQIWQGQRCPIGIQPLHAGVGIAGESALEFRQRLVCVLQLCGLVER